MLSTNFLSSLLLVAVTLNYSMYVVSAHSWVECVNYNPSQLTTYEADACTGFPRCGLTQKNAGFGVDTGFNHHANTCQCSYAEGLSDYAAAPQAQYTPGQRVCLAYPAKNHVADAQATNVYIPDGGVTISRTAVGNQADAFEKTYGHLNGEHVQGQADYKGFQNCPDFANNPDKAMCTMCFDLEADLAPGEYSFSWAWAFNGPADVYTTCWDATVSADADTATTATPPPPAVYAPSPTTTAATPVPTEGPSVVYTPSPTTVVSTPAPTEAAPVYTNAPPATEQPASAPTTPSYPTEAPTTAPEIAPETVTNGGSTTDYGTPAATPQPGGGYTGESTNNTPSYC